MYKKTYEFYTFALSCVDHRLQMKQQLFDTVSIVHLYNVIMQHNV